MTPPQKPFETGQLMTLVILYESVREKQSTISRHPEKNKELEELETKAKQALDFAAQFFRGIQTELDDIQTTLTDINQRAKLAFFNLEK